MLHAGGNHRNAGAVPSRCCRHLAGSAFLGLICREDAGSTWVHGESPFGLATAHWDHEPTPNPSQEGNCEDAEETPTPLLGGVGGGSVHEKRQRSADKLLQTHAM